MNFRKMSIIVNQIDRLVSIKINVFEMYLKPYAYMNLNTNVRVRFIELREKKNKQKHFQFSNYVLM